MKRRGYRPAVQECPDLAKTAADLQTLRELLNEMLADVRKLNGRRITRAELKRDFGFTETGMKLLERARFLVPEAVTGRRKSYELGEALRVAAFFPGFAAAPITRIRRKSQNITTVLRDVFRKVAHTGF